MSRVDEISERWANKLMGKPQDWQDIARLVRVARAAEKLDWAVKLYLKHSNSPVCIGWDEMLDALTELDKAIQEVQP